MSNRNKKIAISPTILASMLFELVRYGPTRSIGSCMKSLPASKREVVGRGLMKVAIARNSLEKFLETAAAFPSLFRSLRAELRPLIRERAAESAGSSNCSLNKSYRLGLQMFAFLPHSEIFEFLKKAVEANSKNKHPHLHNREDAIDSMGHLTSCRPRAAAYLLKLYTEGKARDRRSINIALGDLYEGQELPQTVLAHLIQSIESNDRGSYEAARVLSKFPRTALPHFDALLEHPVFSERGLSGNCYVVRLIAEMAKTLRRQSKKHKAAVKALRFVKRYGDEFAKKEVAASGIIL